NVRLAHQAWEAAQVEHMHHLLEEAARRRPGDEDLRGFEWHYLWRLGHPEGQTLQGHTGWGVAGAFSPPGPRPASPRGGPPWRGGSGGGRGASNGSPWGGTPARSGVGPSAPTAPAWPPPAGIGRCGSGGRPAARNCSPSGGTPARSGTWPSAPTGCAWPAPAA